MIRIAVPCEGERIAEHFGHASRFVLFDADPDSGQIVGEESAGAPPHQPGLLPQWLDERGANVVLAGGMGVRARDLFAERGIKVVVGMQTADPKEAVEGYLKGSLSGGMNPCDH